MLSTLAIDRRAAERTLILVRWFVVSFLFAEIIAYKGSYPDAALTLASGVALSLALANFAFTVWYIRWPSGRSMERLSMVAMGVDTAAVVLFVAAHGFDQHSPMFALIYLLPLSAAIRYGWAGAMVGATVGGIAYVGAELIAARSWGVDVPTIELILPVAIGFLVGGAAAATSLCHQHERSIISKEADDLRLQDDLKNTFLHAVSHELRTPLTSIMGFAITLQDRADELTPEHREMLTWLASEAGTLDRLLSDLLDLDRLTRGTIGVTPEPLDVADVVGRTCERLSASGRTIDVTCESIVAVVDETKLERIVENLVGNALKYTPTDAPVSVDVARHEDGVLLVVNDSGPGIPDDLVDHIFEPFQRGADAASWAGGSGIGLSLVERFCRLHGGRAWVSNREGGGASFRVWLPLGDLHSFEAASLAPWPSGAPSPA